MKSIGNGKGQNVKPVRVDFFEHIWEGSWAYIKTVVDIVREPILILDKNLCVMAANEPFYKMFQVEANVTEGNIVYELGNGQWDIPALRKLLEDILPKNTFFKGYEVTHDFPIIGRKIMILNARQMHFEEDKASKLSSPIILLAMEDITDMMLIADTLADYAKVLELKLAERTKKMEKNILKLEKEIEELKKHRKKK